MSVRCRACGRDNADGAQFCANPDCGGYLGWEPEPPHPVPGGGTYPGAFPVPAAAPGPPPSGRAAVAPPAAGWDGRDQHVGLRATIADPLVEVSPGSTGSTTLSVYNTGTQVEGLVVTLSGPAARWSAIEPSRLSVYPDQAATVTVRFAPPRAPSCAAGRAWYTVRLDSTVHPGLAASVNGAAEVAAYHDLAAELVPATSSGRGATKHHVVAHNRGNVTERAQLAAADDEGAFGMELARTAIDLPPGSSSVPLTVRPRRRWFGRPRTVAIHATLAVADAGPPLRVDGTRTVLATFPRWLSVTALVTALLVGGAAAVAALVDGDGKPPGDGPTGSASTQQLTFLERVGGDWKLQSWTEAGGPVMLYLDVERGTLKISADGLADWRLDIDQRGEDNKPQPGITCGGRATLEERIEAQPGGGRNSTINWTSDLSSIDHSATGQGWIWRAMCGWTVAGGRYPFAARLGGQPDEPATRMEMSNQWGTFVWVR